MKDDRVTSLATLLVNHSCQVQKGEHVLIEIFGDDRDLAKELTEQIYAVGGFPHIQIHDQRLLRSVLMGTSPEHMEAWTQYSLSRMKMMDCYIGIRGNNNDSELQDVPTEQMQLYMKNYNHRVHSECRVKETKWVVLRYPTPAMAQSAKMSTDAFEDFYFNVCNLDYQQMDKAMKPLVKRMERTNRVRLVGEGTDLTFSIQGIPVVPCAGERNIPDGEVFTAPVRDSVNGMITFNTPSPYSGEVFEKVHLQFEQGRIVKASANNTKRLNEILDTDEGARYIGEFSLGVNPYIHHPMLEILFDEKIHGSFHFTPGQAYEEADNGNRSAVHWDMVCIQREEYGGGEIYFDGELIRKDGRFVVEDLEPLNPENLKRG